MYHQQIITGLAFFHCESREVFILEELLAHKDDTGSLLNGYGKVRRNDISREYATLLSQLRTSTDTVFRVARKLSTFLN